LASPIAADQITNLTIDKEERDKDKPSDHVPIIAEINI
jgi:exodeoxyribonuclease-3